MLDWLFGTEDGEDRPRRVSHLAEHEAEALPAWLHAGETRRDWDVLGEPNHCDAHAPEPTELPAWRQSEAQLDALLSASFWELERHETPQRRHADADEGREADRRRPAPHRAPS